MCKVDAARQWEMGLGIGEWGVGINRWQGQPGELKYLKIKQFFFIVILTLLLP